MAKDDRLPRPPYDPEFGRQVAATKPTSGRYEIQAIRDEAMSWIRPEMKRLFSSRDVSIQDVSFAGPRGDLTLATVRPKQEPRALRPCIFFIHGGAMIRSNRYAGLAKSIEWATEHDAITVSVEYGLAPENVGVEPAEDCFEAFQWVKRNAASLGIDLPRMVVYGASAGGGLAAAMCLMLRDRGELDLCGLFLEAPMLDDRCETISAQQYTTGPMFNSTLNQYAWRCLLGARAGGEDVHPYEAPSRAADLCGFPPTYLDCATADPFRDEVVAFASKLWASGVAAEMHTWPGGFHGFDASVPSARISKLALVVRANWMGRVLSDAAFCSDGPKKQLPVS